MVQNEPWGILHFYPEQYFYKYLTFLIQRLILEKEHFFIILNTHIMGFSKADAFPMDQQILAICGKLISHPARIQIIQYLIRNGSSSMQEIADSIPLNRRSVTQHLTKLRSHGLLLATVKTPYVIYEVDERALANLVKQFNNFFIDRLEVTI